MSDQEAEEKKDDSQGNQKRGEENDQKSSIDQPDPIAVMLISDKAKRISFSRKCDADDDSQENVDNKEENQKHGSGVEDFRTPLEKTSSQFSRTSAPLPITDSVTTLKDPNYPEESYTRRLLSDVETQIGFSGKCDADDNSRENVENKEENQKPKNDMEDIQTLLKKRSTEASRTTFTLKEQNPRRQEPNVPYTRRLLYDVETQIGFFRGFFDYNEYNNRYPFLNSKSMKEFIAYWLQVDVSVRDLREAVKQLKLQYEKRLREVEGELERLDPEKDRVFDWAHKIWGNPKKPTISSVYDKGECSTKCQDCDDYGDDDQGAMKKMKKNPGSTAAFNRKISILNSILDYKQVTGRNPFDDYTDLVSFNTNWVPLKVPVENLTYLVCNLMFEYKEIRERTMYSLKSVEEQQFYELAHQIWGR